MTVIVNVTYFYTIIQRFLMIALAIFILVAIFAIMKTRGFFFQEINMKSITFANFSKE